MMKIKCAFKSFRCKLLTSILLLLLLCCQSSETKPGKKLSPEENDNLRKAIGELRIRISANDALLIVPFEGCGACIDHAFNFVTQQAQPSHSVTLIITDGSTMAINLALKKVGIDRSRVVVDGSGVAIRYGLLTLRPVMIHWYSDDEAYSVFLSAGELCDELKKFSEPEH